MEQSKARKRRFSLENAFMNYKIDDILFGAMYYLATYHPEEKVFYLTKKNFTKNKTVIKKMCGDVSTQTLNNHLRKLAQAGLIKEQDIKVGQLMCPSYVFIYEYEERYQLVEQEMLWYILATRSQQAVKLYIYLLNKYNWKKTTDEIYIFTNKELIGALGYSTHSDNQLANSTVSNILESFKREGIIDYETFYDEAILDDGKTIPVPRKKLLFLASTKADLPAV